MTTGENLGLGAEELVALSEITEDPDTDLRDFVPDVSDDEEDASEVVATAETRPGGLVIQEALGAVITTPQVIMPPRHIMTAAVTMPMIRTMRFHVDGHMTFPLASVTFPHRGTF